MISYTSFLIGRFLLGLYFFFPGLMKVAAPEATIAYMQGHDIPFAAPLMWFSTATNIIGGALLIFGRHVKLVAFACVVYVLLVNFMLHDFWTMTEDAAPRERQNFVKNLGIVGGLLVLAGAAPARSLLSKNWWRSDKAVTS